MSDEHEPTEPFRTFETEEDFQSFLDGELAKARKSGESKGKRTAKSMSAAERAELEELRREKEESEDQRLVDKQKWDELRERQEAKHAKALEERDGQISRLTAELRTDRCHLALVRAATGLAFNPEQVATLLDHRLRLTDDGHAVVLGTDGEVDEQLTPELLVKQFLERDENANLARAASSNGGSGARGSSSSNTDQGEIAKLQGELDELKAQASKSRVPPEALMHQIHAKRRELDAKRRET